MPASLSTFLTISSASFGLPLEMSHLGDSGTYILMYTIKRVKRPPIKKAILQAKPSSKCFKRYKVDKEAIILPKFQRAVMVPSTFPLWRAGTNSSIKVIDLLSVINLRHSFLEFLCKELTKSKDLSRVGG